MSIRQLQLTLKDRRVSPSSYSTVNGFFRGKADPSVPWLRKAAGILRVRADWLVDGEGEMTEAGQVVSELAEFFDSAYPTEAEFRPHVRALFLDTLERQMEWDQRFRAYEGEGPVSTDHDSAGWLLGSMTIFWDARGIAHPDRTTREFSDFAAAWFTAINMAIKVPVEVIERATGLRSFRT